MTELRCTTTITIYDRSNSLARGVINTRGNEPAIKRKTRQTKNQVWGKWFKPVTMKIPKDKRKKKTITIAVVHVERHDFPHMCRGMPDSYKRYGCVRVGRALICSFIFPHLHVSFSFLSNGMAFPITCPLVKRYASPLRPWPIGYSAQRHFPTKKHTWISTTWHPVSSFLDHTHTWHPLVNGQSRKVRAQETLARCQQFLLRC